MQRYFIDKNNFLENSIIIHGDDAMQIAKVLRMKKGDIIICCDNLGKSAKCKLVEISNESVKADIVEWLDEQSELPVKVTIAHGLPKGDKLELVVQKGTELGAASFLPFFAARSIVKWDEKKGGKKVERLQKICKEAAEQSHRVFIPKVLNPVSFNELIKMSQDFDIKVVAYEENARENDQSGLSKCLTQLKSGDKMLVVIGPEGGLTEAEVNHLSKHDFIVCGLGPRILRTETAPLYVLSAISYHTELLE